MKTNPQSNKNHLIKVAALVAALAIPGVTLADEVGATAVHHTSTRTAPHRVVVEQASYDTMTAQPDRAVRTSALRFNSLDGEPIR